MLSSLQARLSRYAEQIQMSCRTCGGLLQVEQRLPVQLPPVVGVHSIQPQPHGAHHRALHAMPVHLQVLWQHLHEQIAGKAWKAWGSFSRSRKRPITTPSMPCRCICRG